MPELLTVTIALPLPGVDVFATLRGEFEPMDPGSQPDPKLPNYGRDRFEPTMLVMLQDKNGAVLPSTKWLDDYLVVGIYECHEEACVAEARAICAGSSIAP